MCRALSLLFAIAACGRLGFDPVAAVGDGTVDGAFPLPATLVCSATRIPVSSLGVDLAIQSDGNEIAVLWPSGNGVTLVRIGTTLVASPESVLQTGPVDAIPGIAVAGSATLFVTVHGTQQRLWHVDGPTLTMVGEETSVAASNGLPTDSTRAQFVWLRASGSDLLTSFVSPTGAVGSTRAIARSAPVTRVAGADNADHVHAMWTEGTECRQGDLDLIPPAPSLGGNGMIGTDCNEPRIDSGPANGDSILTVWRSSASTIEAWHQGAVGDMGTRLSALGHSPRIRFDGTRFWVVWVDTQAGNVVRIAALEQDLTFATVDLVGWPLPSNEGFEVVKLDATVYLAMLVDEALWLLETCP